jgi:hypothetical protein
MTGSQEWPVRMAGVRTENRPKDLRNVKRELQTRCQRWLYFQVPLQENNAYKPVCFQIRLQSGRVFSRYCQLLIKADIICERNCNCDIRCIDSFKLNLWQQILIICKLTFQHNFSTNKIELRSGFTPSFKFIYVSQTCNYVNCDHPRCISN